jgi:arsenate reductase
MIPNRFAILGHPQRLALFRLLMRRYPGRVPASELAAALRLKPNTLSTYIGALMQAGLVTQERAGTSLRYAINMPALRETFDYLLFDCCRGRPEICAPFSYPAPDAAPGTSAASAPSVEKQTKKYSALFICTGNSARSIFAEALLRRLAGDRFDVYSAGTHPRAAPHPMALTVLRQQGHDVSNLRSKTIAEFQGAGAPRMDFVFTVCDDAANEDCPAWPGLPACAHWGMADPAQAGGTQAEQGLAFHLTYGALERRIRAFAALPIDALDRVALQGAVDAIGQTDPAMMPPAPHAPQSTPDDQAP